jgi:hypothetical protein
LTQHGHFQSCQFLSENTNNKSNKCQNRYDCAGEKDVFSLGILTLGVVVSDHRVEEIRREKSGVVWVLSSIEVSNR